MLRSGKMEGIGYFTYESMKRITMWHPEHQFLFLFDRPFDPQFIFADNITPVVVPPAARHPLLWYVWCEWALPRIFKKYKPDLFVGTDGYLSLRSNMKSLAVIHDIHFAHQPKDLPFFPRTFLRHYFPKYAQTADRIAAVSNFTANDIVSHYNVDRAKIDVVYNGAAEGFRPTDKNSNQKIREKYSHGQPYFLFIGAIHQRKNITYLLKAFDQFKKNISSPVKLVFAGNRRWWTTEMETVFNELSCKPDIIFTGRISNEDLYAITGGALAVTYVSTFEGFGIPIVEGMKAGVPVLTSNITSMPEIAGDAALLCDPFSIESISAGLTSLYSDEKLRSTLIQKGTIRARDFTWDKTADGLWASIEKVLNTKQ